MSLPRVVLLGSALPFAAIGLAFLLAPGQMAGFVGVSLAGATADADVRAVYGGLQLGCAAVLVTAASRPHWWRPGVAAQLALYGGLAGARFVSLPIAGVPSALGLALHAGELLGVVAGWWAWRSLRDRPVD